MTGVVFRLRRIGYELEADGEEVVYRWTGPGHPDPATVLPLLEDLKVHKVEALALLEAEANRPPVDPDGPCPPYPFRIRSRTLDAEVWIVPDGWSEPVSGPAYTWAEVRELERQNATPEELRAVHLVKAHLDGEVLNERPV